MLPPKAFFLLVLVILLLSALASTNFSTGQRLLTEGEIAPEDVTADRTFLFEDKRATRARRDLAERMQPLVLDLAPMPADVLHDQIRSLLLKVNEAHTTEQRDVLRQEMAADLGDDVGIADVNTLSSPVVQNVLLSTILPQALQRLQNGVIADIDLTRPYPGGVLVRNIATGEETLLQDSYRLPDLKSLELQLVQHIKTLPLSSQARQTLSLVFSRLMRPTLAPNYGMTTARAEQAARAVVPVLYRVLKGETIVQQGERVTQDQQVKMQVMLQRKNEPFRTKTFMGISLCALLISGGLLFAPSAKPGTRMGNKDFIFLSCLLLVFALMSKGLALHGEQIAEVTVKFLPESLAYGVPVAGAAALSALIFSARRYLVTGILLSFFCALMMGGGLALFLFYFLSAMWSTWLTNRTTSRNEVVWSLLPLTAGMLAMWAGASLLQGGAHNRYLSEIIAVIGGAFVSMVLTFALAPLVEMVFRYTTRFRLMELLNLEQPLLRDLMLNAPGTYHHSLIVSNMCEAGAKRVGAHSLLCKVAALYHDIGKVTKAGYFIENQTTVDNPHDRLAPSMSALILIAHVKQGVELAKQHRLGDEVTGIIRQHHGTSVIQFFYRKALALGNTIPPNIEDFRYPGPRPRTREAALVMLADIVEASSRCLSEPTPTRLMQHIESIMKSIHASGQLDECELSFKDLSLLADSFYHVLRGIFHHRISYPGQEKTAKPLPLTAPPTPPAKAAAPSAPTGTAPAASGTGYAQSQSQNKPGLPRVETPTVKQ